MPKPSQKETFVELNPGQLQGQPIIGHDGEKIGTAENVYLDNQTDRPEWVEVKTGLFGSKSALVPLANAEPDPAGGIRVPYDKARIKSAPHHYAEQQLSADDEAELFRYYEIPYAGRTVTADAGAGFTEPAHAESADMSADVTGRAADFERGYDTGEPGTDDAMTRSEERLNIGTQFVEAGRARLRKYLVTEQVHQTVPVTHEEVRVEREPITDANRQAAYRGADLSEAEHEVVLTAERPVVAKETVPVERVRLDTEQVTEEAHVSETLRREEIDTEGIDEARRRD
jgi:uncharacterized protein (TIGR02271 family)